MGQCIVLLGKNTPPPLILSFVLNLNLNRILCTINRLAGCFEPEVRTGPKNVAVSDLHLLSQQLLKNMRDSI